MIYICLGLHLWLACRVKKRDCLGTKWSRAALHDQRRRADASMGVALSRLATAARDRPTVQLQAWDGMFVLLCDDSIQDGHQARVCEAGRTAWP